MFMRDKVKSAIGKVETLRDTRAKILQRINPDLNEEAKNRIHREAEDVVRDKLPKALNALHAVLAEAEAGRRAALNPLLALVKAARAASFDAGPGVAVLASALIRLRDDELRDILPGIAGNPLLVAAAYAEIRNRPGDGIGGTGPNVNMDAVEALAAGYVEEDNIKEYAGAEVEALSYLAGVASTPEERLEYGHRLAELHAYRAGAGAE